MDYVLWIVIAIVVLCGLYIVLTFNKLIRLNNEVREAFSVMDVYLKKRWDLVPNIVETVKGYAKHEKDTLKEVVEMRNSIKSYDSLSSDEKIKTNEEIMDRITRLMALAESYPDLKANENFLDLQHSLKSIEDEIAQSRKYYNAVVRIYNNKVEMVPSNIIAKMFGYKTKLMFQINEEERTSVEVKI